MFEIGSSLREARLRQGVELTEAEVATKIRAKYLRALEDERFELLPAQTYVKGFLHSYAEYLGLDGQLYVDEFNSRYFVGEDGEAPQRVRRSYTPSRAHRRAESSVLVLALAGIAAVTALVVVAWKWGGSEPNAIPNLGTEPPAQTAPSVQPPARQEAATVLELTATEGNSWIAVNRNAVAGNLIFSGTLERGRSMTFEGDTLFVQATTPENLRARINGDRSLIPGNDGRPVVLRVTPRGFRVISNDS